MDIENKLISAVEKGLLEEVQQIIDTYGLSYTWDEGYELLCIAIENGKAKVASLLLNEGARVNAEQLPSDTPLHLAALNDDEKLLQKLLRRGANTRATNRCGETPLHLAVNSEAIECVELLLKKYAEVNVADKQGITPLHIAAKKGYYEIAECLLIYEADVDPTARQDIFEEHTPLQFAIANNKSLPKYSMFRMKDAKNCRKTVGLLLKYGASANVTDKKGDTPLHTAAKYGLFDILKDLAEHGACVNSTSSNGCTPLHYAVEEGSVEIVKYLSEKGANVNITNKDGNAPLHIAAEKDDCEELTKCLLCNGASIFVKNASGKTPLHIAVERKHTELVKFLLENGASTGKNLQPLSKKPGNVEIVKVLSEIKAHVNSRDARNRTPLHIAVENGDLVITKKLLSFGADVNVTDCSGNTALHIAILKKQKRIVSTLIQHGAVINILNKRNQTALCILLGMREDFWMAKVIVEYIVKMEIANLILNKNIRSAIKSAECKERYLDNFSIESFKEEVVRMKNEVIEGSNDSFYDFLRKSTDEIALFTKNEEVVQVLTTKAYKRNFPIYADMIQNHFKMGMERRDLLEKSSQFFHILCNGIPQLSYDCTEKVFSYLSNSDLRNLIQVCMFVKIGNIRDKMKLSKLKS